MNNNKANHQINTNKRYWHANLKLLSKLLLIWFAASFGCGILLADWLDQFTIVGFKLGFWFAQQGAIYIFVVLIFVYSYQMKALDRKFGVDDNMQDSPEQESQS
jgi:putative solute:sodium symporter small subunit